MKNCSKWRRVMGKKIKHHSYVINMYRLALNTKTVRAKEKSSMSKQSNIVALKREVNVTVKFASFSVGLHFVLTHVPLYTEGR